MENKNNIYWIVATKNTLVLICFTVLSIVFHKWWIVFFSAFFLTSVKHLPLYYRICDGCGKHSEYADNYDEALEKAKKAGWIKIKKDNKWYDYCPECQNKNNIN